MRLGGTPVLVERVRAFKIRIPPHPQNTSAMVGNLKYWSGSIGSWVLSEIRPIDPVRPIEKETQKRVDRVGDVLGFFLDRF